MRIGHFSHGWWKAAIDALSQEAVDLPISSPLGGNAYQAHFDARINNAQRVLAQLRERPVDLLLDNGGTGLGFLPDAKGQSSVDLLHERLQLPLISHFVDPLNTAMQGLEWPTVWQALQSGSWIKAVWDRAQAVELQQFGVPNVLHLPMGAPVREYDREPLEARRCTPVVSFVGGQNTSFFQADTSWPTLRLVPGTLAQAIQTDLPEVHFIDAYYDIFGLAEPVQTSDDLKTVIEKTAGYYNAKLFYQAALCIQRRDRFVIFLKRKLGELFRLIGTRWDAAYGLPVEPPFPRADAYFNHFRETAINLNFVNGNAETGLNLRHFEITAAGGFMLCYRQPELRECFAIGKECEVFDSEKDLLDKIQYYMARPEERAAIALAGQKRTLSEHLFSHRLATLLRQARAIVPSPSLEFSSSTWQQDVKVHVPVADVVLDCGANVGQMATAFRRLYPQATIYSFEPVDAAFDVLRRCCAELNVHPVKKGVADYNGRAVINLTAGPEACSLLGFQEGNPCAKWTRVVGHENVEVCTLDRWCAESGVSPDRVDIIKLDVQGAELKALYGARQLLKSVKLIYLEVSFVPIYKDSPLLGDIDSFMRECSYRRYALYPSDQPQNWGDALYVKT